jgi:hypothetical protein
VAKYTNTVTLAVANTWQELSALANVSISGANAPGIQIAVADAVGDLAGQDGNTVSQKDGRIVQFNGLGTKKVFARGPAGRKLIVTAYA